MGRSANHSAAGQALGYIHQAQWALIELVQRAHVAPTTELRLETLDDIEMTEVGGVGQLTQVKHHITPAADLTEHSVDFWRTLNVWMDVFTTTGIASRPVLKLVTTALIPSGGTLSQLKGDSRQRDVDAALKSLEAAARQGSNQTSSEWRNKFLDMRPADRLALLDAISIEDGAPRARDVAEVLSETLRLAAPRGHKETFVTYLVGWWHKICVHLLDGTLGAVTADDLDARISELRDQFLPDNLPMAPAILVPFSEEDAVPYRDRVFVQQLVWIALDAPRLWRAIRDYHRAWAQRSEWLRLNLVSEVELDRYAFRLHDEWDHVFHQRVAKMRRENSASAEVVGQEILEQLSAESRARVRERFDEPWLNRGTLHALADGWSGRRIGWHPEFQTKLAELLGSVVK